MTRFVEVRSTDTTMINEKRTQLKNKFEYHKPQKYLRTKRLLKKLKKCIF